MTDTEFFGLWLVGVGMVAVVILLAAILLLGVLYVARSILRHGAQALEAAERIAADTQVIWALADTNRVAAEILATAEHIEDNGAVIATALEETQSGPVVIGSVRPAHAD